MKRTKCFTFFSSISKEWNYIKMNLDSIKVTITNNVNWLPPHIIKHYYSALHSPQTIPELSIGQEFVEILSNVTYHVSFSKLNVDRHQSESDFHCTDYSREEKNNTTIRSDCIAMCIMKKSLSENWPYAPSSMKTLFRKEHINEMSNYNLNKMKMTSMYGLKKLGEECDSLCKQDCQYSYYLYDISVIND